MAIKKMGSTDPKKKRGTMVTSQPKEGSREVKTETFQTSSTATKPVEKAKTTTKTSSTKPSGSTGAVKKAPSGGSSAASSKTKVQKVAPKAQIDIKRQTKVAKLNYKVPGMEVSLPDEKMDMGDKRIPPPPVKPPDTSIRKGKIKRKKPAKMKDRGRIDCKPRY